MTATLINEGGSFETFNDPHGNPLISINRDGTISTEGVRFADGTEQTTAGAGGGGSGTPAQGIDATQYGVMGNGHFVFGFSATENSSVITYALGGFLLNATVGQIVFGSNLGKMGGQAGATLVLPQGTIVSVNSDTQITVSTVSSETFTNGGCLVWGDDESSVLEAAWAVASAANTQLVLPGVNPQKSGPAVILVQSPQLNYGSVSGTGGSRRGTGACGGGINATYLVPTPSFSFPGSGACFLDVNDGGNFHDFTIFGGGNGSAYTGGSTTLAAVQVTDVNNVVIQDMAFIGWGAYSDGIPIGVLVTASECVIRRIDIDMFGNIPCKCQASGNEGYQLFEACSFWDSILCDFYVAGGSNTPVFTVDCNMGGASKELVSVNGGGVWYDIRSYIGVATSESGNGILIGYTNTPGGIVQGTGTASLIGTVIDSSFEGGGSCLYLNSSADSVTLQGCTLRNETGSAGTYVINNNGGNITDAGGNETSQVSGGGGIYNGTGNVFGSSSVTGAVQTSGNVALANFGTSPSVGSVSGSSQRQQFTITIGSTPTGTATMTVTFPTGSMPFLVPPICQATVVGGTNTSLGSFTTGTVTTTSAEFIYQGTLIGSDTLVVQVTAGLG